MYYMMMLFPCVPFTVHTRVGQFLCVMLMQPVIKHTIATQSLSLLCHLHMIVGSAMPAVAGPAKLQDLCLCVMLFCVGMTSAA